MRDAGIGRVLVASLHQGIADVLPMRLTFYENWLNAEGLRGGTIGLAAVNAVLSFLRQEGSAYRTITARAGEYTAEWTVETMSSFQRSVLNAAPAWLRTRLLLRIGRRLVNDCFQGTHAAVRVKKGTARISVTDSVFCSVRDRVGDPLCGFYAAMYTRLFSLFHLPTTATVVACRATGEQLCTLNIPLSADANAASPESALSIS
jgi:bacteriochlorophyll 4-vinyl reductase